MSIVELICANCEKPFERKSYRVRGKNSFCSHKCQIAYVTTNQPKYGMADLVCGNCDQPFQRKESAVRHSKRMGVEVYFCSRKCHYEHATGNGPGPEMVDLVCDVCGQPFQRRAKHERQLRKDREFICCSRKCATLVAKSERSDYAPLKYYLSQAARNTRSIPVSLSIQDLIDQWDRQNGLCPYTGEPMVLKNTKNRGDRIPYQASLDRVDSSLGYVPENIEFVSAIANYAKSTWTREVVLDFCERTSQYHAKR